MENALFYCNVFSCLCCISFGINKENDLMCANNNALKKAKLQNYGLFMRMKRILLNSNTAKTSEHLLYLQDILAIKPCLLRNKKFDSNY